MTPTEIYGWIDSYGFGPEKKLFFLIGPNPHKLILILLEAIRNLAFSPPILDSSTTVFHLPVDF